MKKLWFKLILICMVFAIVVSSVGCQVLKPDGPSGRTPRVTPKPTPRDFIGKITFSTYKSSPSDRSASEFMYTFVMEYPGVEVIIDEKNSAEEYFATLDDRIANGTIGDVFVIDDSRIAEYVEKDYIVDYTPYLQNLIEYKNYSKLKPAEILFDAAYKSSTYKGKMYMVATDYNHQFVYINYDLFEKAGLDVPKDKWTWEEFKKCAEALSKVEGIEVPVVMDYTDNSIWGVFTRGFGGILEPEPTPTPAPTPKPTGSVEPTAKPEPTPVKHSDGKMYIINPVDQIKTLTLSDPEVIYGLKDLAEFVKSGYVQNIDVTPDKLGSIGMIVTDKMEFNTWTDALKSADYDWDLIHFPSVKNRKAGAKTLGLAVNKKTLDVSEEQKDMSVQFALQALINEAAVAYAGTGESVPAIKSVNAMKFWREYPVKGKNTSVFSNYTSDDFPAYITYMMNLDAAKELKVAEALEAYIRDGKALEESMADIDRTVNDLWEQEPVYAPSPSPSGYVATTPSPANTPE